MPARARGRLACQARATAVSELVQGYEERLEEERASGAALAQRLKEALDRSAKMRSHAERDRRAMQVRAPAWRLRSRRRPMAGHTASTDSRAASWTAHDCPKDCS